MHGSSLQSATFFHSLSCSAFVAPSLAFAPPLHSNRVDDIVIRPNNSPTESDQQRRRRQSREEAVMEALVIIVPFIAITIVILVIHMFHMAMGWEAPFHNL